MMLAMSRRVWLLCLSLFAACRGVSPDPAALAARPLPDVTLTEAQRAVVATHARAATDALAAWDFALAEASAEAALAIDPRTARARAVLGLCLQHRAGQRQPTDLALQNEGDGETLRAVALAPADPLVGRLRAEFLARSGHLSAAALAAEEALQRSRPPSADAVPDPERTLLVAQAADHRFELGEERLARPHLRELVQLRPDDAEAWFRLGHCRLVGDDVATVAGAAGAFQRCAELRPDDRVAARAVGTSHLRAAELAERLGQGPARTEQLTLAAAAFAAAADRFPDDADAVFGLGVVREAQGDAAAAQVAYGRGLEQDPDHVGCLLNQAALLAADTANPASRGGARLLLDRVLALADAGKADLTRRERERIQAWVAAAPDPAPAIRRP